MKRAIPILAALLLAALVLSGCKSNLVRVKPTPTAAPTRAGSEANTTSAAASGARIVTEGHVVPARKVTLSFPTGGIVSQVPAEVGQKVAAGAVLAQLDTKMLELQMAQAEANLAGAEAKLKQLDQGPDKQSVTAAAQAVAAAQATYDKSVGGPSAADVAAAKAALAASQQHYAEVRKGPSAESLTQLAAQLASAKANLDQAQAAYDPVSSRSDVGMLPQSLALQQATIQYQAARSAYEAAKNHPTAAELAAAASQVEQAQAALNRLTGNPADVEAARAAVENAKAQLAQLQKGPSADERAVLEAGVKAAQASRDLVDAQIKSAALVAPFAGELMKVNLGQGEYAAAGAPVVLLADSSAWRLETTDLTELYVADVSAGAPVSVTFDAIPGLELTGRISAIEPFGESKQGDIVYTATVLLDQQDPRLRWNMTAKVKIG